MNVASSPNISLVTPTPESSDNRSPVLCTCVNVTSSSQPNLRITPSSSKSTTGASMSKYDVEVEKRLKALEAEMEAICMQKTLQIFLSKKL